VGQGDLAGRKKGALAKGAWIVFEDESGISLIPPVRRTWAPRGKTPIVKHPYNWKSMSMAAVLAYRPDGSRSRVLFQTRAGAYETQSLIAFVRQLRRHFCGQPVILIWDGLPGHRSTDMKRFLAAQQSWLEVVRLPGYAPELNPVEGLWAYLKGSHLANLNTRYIEEMEIAAEDAIDAVRARRDLPFAFLRHAGLSLCSSVS